MKQMYFHSFRKRSLQCNLIAPPVCNSQVLVDFPELVV